MDKLRIVAKVIGFAFTSIWLLLYCLVVMMCFFWFTALVGKFVPEEYGWFISVLQAWYIFTFVVIGTLIAVRGFKLIGKWEQKYEGK